MSRRYLKFTDAFCKLNPYELSHFSEHLLCKIEDICEGLPYSQQKMLTEKEVKYALVEAVRDIDLQIREREINNEHRKLDRTKALLFSNKTNAA